MLTFQHVQTCRPPPLSGLRKVKTKLKGLLLLQEQASSATLIILRVREAATRISRHPLCLRTLCQGHQVILDLCSLLFVQR